MIELKQVTLGLVNLKSPQPTGNTGDRFSIFCENKKAPQVGRFEREANWLKFTINTMEVKGNLAEFLWQGCGFVSNHADMFQSTGNTTKKNLRVGGRSKDRPLHCILGH